MITRYMESQFVDDFFNEGKLRLSSFKKFRNNPDEQQGDVAEGRANMKIATPNGNHTILATNGQEAYVLCGGTVENKNMEASFKTADGFRIINTLAFADAISRYIPGFIGGVEGLCSYRDSLLINDYDEKSIVSPDQFASPEEWAKEYDKYVAEKSSAAFFIKQLKFAHQGEYRFIWFTTSSEEKEHLDIVCPEARRFCQRLTET
ncbi:hypothetical protein [Cellvibrio sp. UBA7671]|uniref:hypothetical protein n=1 Tax=Cellvibrio sp. UBA7671 TaxID=1946312 RepID=UPI002F351881